MRVGIGYDIHRLKKGRKLLLGGVHVPYDSGCLGHSDGDVLIHAIVDAVLGAAGAGDIGAFFPDKDTRFKDADSRHFLRELQAVLTKKKLKIVNIDAVVIAERPSMASHKKKMCIAIAKELGIAPVYVNVKAKTNEGLGPVGQGAAIACYAVASLKGK